MLIVGCAKPPTAHKSTPKPQPVAQIQSIEKDTDGDGVPDRLDACANSKEDHDSHHDDDGCLDQDNDNDGVNDTEDKCPNIKGNSPNGCLNTNLASLDPDKDNDGILNPKDKCPNKPEDYDFTKDDDGCPDEKSNGFRPNYIRLKQACELISASSILFRFEANATKIANTTMVAHQIGKLKTKQFALLRINHYGRFTKKPTKQLKARSKTVLKVLKKANIEIIHTDIHSGHQCGRMCNSDEFKDILVGKLFKYYKDCPSKSKKLFKTPKHIHKLGSR